MALNEGLGELEWIEGMWAEAHVAGIRLEDFRDGHHSREGVIYQRKDGDADFQKYLSEIMEHLGGLSEGVAITDCKSVYDVLSKNSISNDKRTAVELQVIKEHLRRRGHQIRWVDTQKMLVDSFTKQGHDASVLKEILKCGTYSIKAESEELEHRKRCGRSRRAPRKLE